MMTCVPEDYYFAEQFYDTPLGGDLEETVIPPPNASWKPGNIVSIKDDREEVCNGCMVAFRGKDSEIKYGVVCGKSGRTN